MYIPWFIPSLLCKSIALCSLVLSSSLSLHEIYLNSQISADLLALAAPVNLEHMVWKSSHLGHKVQINQGAGCCCTSGFQISKVTSRLGNFICGTVMKETRRQSGRQDMEEEKESLCGKENTQIETRGRRRYRTEVRGER